MKATAAGLGALLLVSLSGPLAHAQYYPPQNYYPQGYYPQAFGGMRPPAPDACGPGFYALNSCGCPYGPIYCLRPPWEPFNGLRPNPGARAAPGMAPQCGGLPPPTALPQLRSAGQAPPPCVSFPTHPFARSPRDFFMWTEVSEDEALRRRLPTVLP